MKFVSIIACCFFFTIAPSQKLHNTKTLLTKNLIDKGGLLIIEVRYSIGEACYSEQTILLQKTDSSLESYIFIDSASYFVNHKNFNWKDTVITINPGLFDDLIKLEHRISKGLLKPTYNCDGDNGRIIHNMTGIYLIYLKEKPTDLLPAKKETISNYLLNSPPKTAKLKIITLSGGFVSARDEILNLGKDFDRCITNWWSN